MSTNSKDSSTNFDWSLLYNVPVNVLVVLTFLASHFVSFVSCVLGIAAEPWESLPTTKRITKAVNDTQIQAPQSDPNATARSAWVWTGSELGLERVPLPAPGRGFAQVRVRAVVHAAGPVDPRAGDAGIPGNAFAGEVTAVGPDASVRVGARVAGLVPAGALATVLNADAAALLPMPADADGDAAFAQAAARVAMLPAVQHLPALSEQDVVLVPHAADAHLGLLELVVAAGAHPVAVVRDAAQQAAVLRRFPGLHISQVVDAHAADTAPLSLLAPVVAALEARDAAVRKFRDDYAKAGAKAAQSHASARAGQPTILDAGLPLALVLARGLDVALSVARHVGLPPLRTAALDALVTRAFHSVEAKRRGRTCAEFASVSQATLGPDAKWNAARTGSAVPNAAARTSTPLEPVRGFTVALLPADPAITAAALAHLAPGARLVSLGPRPHEAAHPVAAAARHLACRPQLLLQPGLDLDDVSGLRKLTPAPAAALDLWAAPEGPAGLPEAWARVQAELPAAAPRVAKPVAFASAGAARVPTLGVPVVAV